MYLTIFCLQINIIIKRVLWHFRWYSPFFSMAHNLINEFVFMVVLYLTVHEILDDVSVCIGNKTTILIAHTSHHHCRFLAAVLVADSQLHVGCIVGWSTCHTSVCLWLCWC